jgi:protein O-mannosyl-transferase
MSFLKISPIKKYLLIFSILALNILLYSKVLNFQFTNLDENQLIVNDWQFLSQKTNLNKVFSRGVFNSSQGQFYRPLLTLSFLIDAQFTKIISPYPFLRTNLILHLLVIISLFYFLIKLKTDYLKAAFILLLFSIHPTHLQTIAWIPGRNDSLLCLFTLWALYFFIKDTYQKSQKNQFFHLLFFSLAFLTKETAIIIPLFCSIFILFYKKEKLPLKYIPLWIIPTFIFFFLKHNTVKAYSFTLFEFASGVLSGLPNLFIHLSKVILPINLSVYQLNTDTSYIFSFLIGVSFLASIFFFKKKNKKIILLATMAFFIFLLPASIKNIILYHRHYLSLTAFILFFFPFHKKLRHIEMISLAALSVAFIYQNVQFSKSYETPFNYWGNAIRTSPSSSVGPYELV